MRFRSVLGVMVAAVVFFASSAEAQHHRRPTPTPTPTPATASAPTTPPDATPPTTPPQANSRDQEARMLFEAGRLAYAAGRFEDALVNFQRSYEMSGRPVLLYNVGSAADKLRRDAVALDAFRRYLEAMPAAENRPEVEGRIQVLEQAVAAEQARAAAVITPTVEASEGGATAREGEIAGSLGVGAGGDGEQHDDRGGVFTQWWFWTIAGMVIVGGTIATIAAVSGGGGLAQPQPGDDGGVHFVLRMP